jgi:hypothetical protein
MTQPQVQPKRELPDAKYGENKQYEAAQDVARPSDALALPPAPSPTEFQGQQQAPAEAGVPEQLSELVGFGAPSERPGEPITAGAPMGAGPNSMAMGPNAPMPVGRLSQTLAESVAADSSGVIAELVEYFDRMGL